MVTRTSRMWMKLLHSHIGGREFGFGDFYSVAAWPPATMLGALESAALC